MDDERLDGRLDGHCALAALSLGDLGPGAGSAGHSLNCGIDPAGALAKLEG